MKMEWMDENGLSSYAYMVYIPFNGMMNGTFLLEMFVLYDCYHQQQLMYSSKFNQPPESIVESLRSKRKFRSTTSKHALRIASSLR